MYHFVHQVLFGSRGSAHPAWRGAQDPNAGSHEW